LGLQKGYSYPNQGLSCDECGRVFKNNQSLINHKRAHLAKVDSGIELAAAKSESSRLAEEVRVLKLEAEKRKLEAVSRPSIPAQPDAAEQVGLGPMQPTVAEKVQARAFGIQEPPINKSWLDRLLDNPPAMKIAIDGIRGIVGVNQGDSSFTLLKELGIDMKDLLQKNQAPPAGSLKVAGLDLSGMPMTPQVLAAVLDYKAREEAAAKEAEAKDNMAKSWDRMVEMLAPLIAEKLGGSGGQSISSRPSNTATTVTPRFMVCTKCHNPVELPVDVKPGDCINCGCGQEYTVTVGEDRKPQAQSSKPIEVKEPEREYMRCKCGQQLDVTDLPLLTEIKCPVCNTIARITDPDAPLQAKPITQQEKYQSLYEKNGRG
jgi:hypothetical protein